MSLFDQYEREEKERSALPKGHNVALIENVALSSKRSDMISMTLKVGERKAWVNLFFTEKALGITLGKLKTLQVYEEVKALAQDKNNPMEIMEIAYKQMIPLCGTKWDIDVSHREYNDTLQNDIKFLGKLDSKVAQAPSFDSDEQVPF